MVLGEPVGIPTHIVVVDADVTIRLHIPRIVVLIVVEARRV